MATTIELRRGTAAEWTAANPILHAGEAGVETDTGRMKLGNGITEWVALGYVDAAAVADAFAALAAHEADSTGIHGIADTAGLETQTGAQDKADAAQAAAEAASIPLAQKGAADGVATLDSGGKLTAGQIPPLAIGEVSTVGSQAAMLALTAQRGDVAIRTDIDPDGVFILTTDDPTQLANWVQITAPGAVISVAGRTGAVSLAAADITDFTTAVDDVGDPRYATPLQAKALGHSARGLVCFTFDDIWSDHYSTVLPLAESFGGKVTLACNTNHLDAPGGWMTSAQLLDTHNRGHEIATHSATHTNLTTQNSVERAAEYAAKDTIEAVIGVGNSTTWVYPYSDQGRSDGIDLELYDRFDRIFSGNNVGRYIIPIDARDLGPGPFSRLNFMSGGVTSPIVPGLPTVLALIELAARHPVAVVLYTHHVGSNVGTPYLTVADLTAAMQHCSDLGVPMVTLKEAIPAWRPHGDAGFEDSDSDHYWDTESTPDETALTYRSSVDTPANGQQGTRSGHITSTNAAYTGIFWTRANIPVEPGRAYLAKAFLRAVISSGSGGAELVVREFDVTGTAIRTWSSATVTAAAFGTGTSLIVTTDLGCRYVNVGFRCRAIVGDCYFDKMTWQPAIHAVAPPATGGWHKIAETTLGAIATSIDFSNIPSMFSRLKLVAYSRTDVVSTLDSIVLAINGDTTDANYDRQFLSGSNTSASAQAAAGSSGSRNIAATTGDSASSADQFGSLEATFFDIQGSHYKLVLTESMTWSTRAAGGMSVRKYGVGWASTAAINRITLTPSAGSNFRAGSKFALYGLVSAA